MAYLKERWAEDEVLNLPAGEHDYFERKAGKLWGDRHRFLAALSKALSAFANSGGGHIVLGQEDGGSIDGLPDREGRTSMRDWIEQKVPYLVSYPLQAFRCIR